MNFEERVYELEFTLNDTDDSIVHYIRENRQNLNSVSIRQISSELFIAPNAVMRTAKKLGYSGFSELKLSLDDETNPKKLITVENKLLSKLPKNIIQSIELIDEELIDEVAQNMVDCEKILCVGVGESTYFCDIISRALRCLNRDVDFFQNIHDMEFISKRYGKNDMILVISASGSYDRLQQLAVDAKKRGALVCAITHFEPNPLSKIADKTLCFWGERRVVNGYNMTDRSGLMMIVQLLSDAFWRKYLLE